MTREETPPDSYADLPDKKLVRLILTKGDRLPMSFAREVISRGPRMIPLLSDIIANRDHWTRRDCGWCATTHAPFLLGAIGGPEAVESLEDILFRAVETDNDWVCEDFPALCGALGPGALDVLKKIAAEPMWDWYIRAKAMEGMAAVALRHPEREQEVFSFLANIAADPTDEDDARSWAAHVFLDLGRREYQALLDSLVESGVADGYFDKNDIQDAWARGKDLYWYQHDWLEFYSDESLAERQKRWEKEDAAEEPTEAGQEEHEDARKTILSRKGALQALGPDADLARRIREFLDEEEDAGSYQQSLRTQYALAMELHAAIRRRDGEKDTLFKRLRDRLQKNVRRLVEEPDAFALFDVAVGPGELMDWIEDLPLFLTDGGMPKEAAALAKAWAETAGAESLLAYRAVILAEDGQEGEAREQLRENLERFPDDLWVQIRAGDAFRALKDLAAAEARYRESLELASGDYDRKKVRERLIPLLRETGKSAEADALEAKERWREMEEAPAYREPRVRQSPKIGRNDPCPCGSGKKHKKCCLGKEAGSTK